MIGIGVIGTGYGKQVHIPGFLSVPQAKVIGVAASHYEHARRVASDYLLPRCFKNWRDLVDCPDVDAVSIATPPLWHAEIALAAMRAGKAVFCEKPLAMNTKEANQMLRAAERAGITHMVGFEFREIPAFKLAHQILKSGRLGSIRQARVSWIVSNWSDPARPWSWRSSSAVGGGTLGALGIHVFDYLQWMFGPVTSVAADLGLRVPKRLDERGRWRKVTGEDICHLMLRFLNDVPVSVVISAVGFMTVGHWLEIHGERGALILGSDRTDDYGKGFQVWITDKRNKKPVRLPLSKAAKIPPPLDGRIPPFIALAKKFVHAIQNGSSGVAPSFLEGRNAQRVLDAARQAHRERRWISVSSKK